AAPAEHECIRPGRRGHSSRKGPPHRDAAEPFMEEDERRRAGAAARDAQDLEADAVDVDEVCRHAGLARSASRWRSLKRWILPVAVLGRSVTNSIQRGYLYGARRSR